MNITLTLRGMYTEHIDHKVLQQRADTLPLSFLVLRKHGKYVDSNAGIDTPTTMECAVTRKVLGELDEEYMFHKIDVQIFRLKLYDPDSKWLGNNPEIQDARQFVLTALMENDDHRDAIELFNEYEKFKEL